MVKKKKLELVDLDELEKQVSCSIETPYPCAMAECFPKDEDGLPEQLADEVDVPSDLEILGMFGGQTASDYLRQALGRKKFKSLKLAVREKQLELGRALNKEEFDLIFFSVTKDED